MNTYHIGDRTVILVDGQLYERLLPVVTADSATSRVKGVSGGIRLKRRPKGAYSGYGGLSSGESETKGRLQQHDITHMKEMINAGYAAGEIAAKYDVKPAYIYNLKLRMKKDGELVATNPQ